MADGYIEAAWRGTVGERLLVLPDGCVDLISRSGRLYVVGPMRVGRTVEVLRPTAGIRLAAGSARAVLGVSPKELLDEVVPAEAFRTLGHCQTLFEAAARIRHRVEACERVIQVAKALQNAPGASVVDLANHVGWSARHLRRRFTLEVGLSPKRFARIVRLQRVAGAMTGDDSFSSLAFEFGFADQAHLARETQAIAGCRPTVLRRWMSDSFKTGKPPAC